MNSTDPTDWDYERVYYKVPINIHRLILIVTLWILLSAIVYSIFKNAFSILVFSFIFGICVLKYIVLFGVKIYQRIAPISIRQNCRFEPSCSNYMIQSIEKYGFLKGLKKGINRIIRCSHQDGGYDYP